MIGLSLISRDLLRSALRVYQRRGDHKTASEVQFTLNHMRLYHDTTMNAETKTGIHDLSPTQQSEINNRFSYHAPTPDQIERYSAIRSKCKELAILIMSATPQSREQSTAITLLTQVNMMANAAIAINEWTP